MVFDLLPAHFLSHCSCTHANLGDPSRIIERWTNEIQRRIYIRSKIIERFGHKVPQKDVGKTFVFFFLSFKAALYFPLKKNEDKHRLKSKYKVVGYFLSTEMSRAFGIQ